MKFKDIVPLIFLFPLSLGSAHGFAELVVIVHPGNSIEAISKEELRHIYLGKTKHFPNGLKIASIDQLNESKIKKEFYLKVVGKTLSQISSYWSRRIFAGKGSPPRSLASDKEIKAWVASNPESIAYINKKHVDGNAKVIFNVK